MQQVHAVAVDQTQIEDDDFRVGIIDALQRRFDIFGFADDAGRAAWADVPCQTIAYKRRLLDNEYSQR
jgi:hypothetical protein